MSWGLYWSLESKLSSSSIYRAATMFTSWACRSTFPGAPWSLGQVCLPTQGAQCRLSHCARRSSQCHWVPSVTVTLPAGVQHSCYCQPEKARHTGENQRQHLISSRVRVCVCIHAQRNWPEGRPEMRGVGLSAALIWRAPLRGGDRCAV